MDNKRIRQLSLQYLDDNLLPEEWEELRSYLVEEEGKAIFASVLEEAPADVPYGTPDPAVLQRLLHRTFAAGQNPSGRVITLIRRWWVAAAVMLIAGVGGYFLWFPKDKRSPENIPVVEHREIAPGRSGAVLTLADGSKVLLDSLGNGVVAQEQGSQVVLQDGRLVYDPAEPVAEVAFNTMSTPKGRQFQVSLPDGTQVWLNAASSIRYPTVFKGKERLVELTGEAFFEVAKNAQQPFAVKVSGDARVDVLGTSFNVNAYANESSVQATLLQGKVRVVNKATTGIALRPGEQASVTSSGITRKEVDTGQVMAWKNGLFNFKDASLAAIMRQLERWYDIEVEYENGVPEVALMGEMSRDVALQGLLKNLGRMGVNYRLEGRKLIVLPGSSN